MLRCGFFNWGIGLPQRECEVAGAERCSRFFALRGPGLAYVFDVAGAAGGDRVFGGVPA
jgi:hypothetical protein